MQLHVRIEGAPEELGDVLRALSQSEALRATAVELAGVVTPTATQSEPTESGERYVTTRFARRVLKRRRLGPPILKVLKALYEAHPRWLSVQTLQGVAGYEPAQFAGLMGAFGRRVTNTEGYDSDARFFQYEWSDDDEVWGYRLPDSVREALTLEKLV